MDILATRTSASEDGKSTAQRVRLTFCIPTYGRREKVLRLVDSILPQLKDGDELIVSDDASPDGTSSALSRKAGVEVHSQSSNLGMVGNWNYCLHAGSRDWVCLIHDDDELLPSGADVLRRVCGLVHGPGLIAHDSLRGRSDSADAELWYEVREAGQRASLASMFCPSGVVVHRSVIRALGGFDKTFAYSADIEYFARVCANYTSYVIHNPSVIRYVYHAENYQYKTWRRPDFFEQLERVERAVVIHAGLDPTDEVLRSRLVPHLEHILRSARRIGDRMLLREAANRLRGMPGVSRRARWAGTAVSVLGWYPRALF